MDRNDISWRGYWAACPTPFGERGQFEPALLRALLDFYVDEGLHGVLINGTTGEWFSQTDDERRQVAETAIEHAAGRLTVVVGCTAYTAKAVAELAEHAIGVGADGFAATPPPYCKPLPEETVAFFADISRAMPNAPLMVYNWPHGTSVEIGPELASRLANIDSVVALKDSTPNFDQFVETVRRVVDRVRVFGPFMTSEGYAALKAWGGDGTIGGGAVFGAPDPEFWEAYWSGDEETCRAHAARTDRLFAKLWLPGGWAGHFGHYQSQLKAMMQMLGQPGGTVRPPRLPVTDPAALQAIREILVEESLLEPDREPVG
jgi:dihydrodipicolinate synthase/N-acetylneuraminate lyase